MSQDKGIEKLHGAANYHTWRYAMLNTLEYHGLDGAITTDNNGSLLETKADKLKKAKNMIALNIDAALFTHVSKYDSAHAMWEALQRLYEEKGLSRKISLLRTLTSVKLAECESMQSYVDEIVETANKLTNAGLELDDEWLASILLAGLTDHYQPLILGLEASGLDLTSDHVISKLLDSLPGSSSGSAFVVGKTKQRSKKIWKRKCFKCGSTEHMKKDCPKAGNKGGEKDARHGAFIALAASCDTNDAQWYLDSGASSHMTPNRNMLSGIRLNGDLGKISTADGGTAAVRGTGDANLSIDGSKINVKDVLYVPNLSVNLLSISRIVKSGNVVIFSADGCVIKNQNGDTLVKCAESNGVYKIPLMQSCLISKRCDNDIMLWHRKFGHLNGQTLLKMNKLVTGMNLGESLDLSVVKNCQVCSEGKQHVLPFPSSETSSTDILQLLHSDVVGPMETQSIGKARYLLTFVDDYSRAVSAYFLKEKSEVTEKFIAHVKLMERQMGKPVKKIRTDNGTEYLNDKFAKFCESSGIRHQKNRPLYASTKWGCGAYEPYSY